MASTASHEGVSNMDWPIAAVILGVLATVCAGILQFVPNKTAPAYNGNGNGEIVKFREFADFREEVRGEFHEVKEELRHLRERS